MARPYDLLVLGELNADLVLHGDVVPAFGQREQLLDAADLVLGGSGAITAVGAARLGLRVAYAGLAGEDRLGELVLAELAAARVGTPGVQRRGDVATGITVVLARPDGDRAMLTFLGAMAELRADALDPALLASARHLHVASPFLQHALRSGLPALLRAARAAGTSTSLDPGWDPAEAWAATLGPSLEAVDVVLPNAEELRRLTGLDDVEAAAAALAARGPVVVTKLGAEGALHHDGSEPVRLGAPPAAGETTGAGDSFDAGYLAALLDGRPPLERLALGNACGALSLRGTGGTAGQPTRDEAEALARRLLTAPPEGAGLAAGASSRPAGAAHTARELASQPDVWRRALAVDATALPPSGARVLALGCGTSFHVLDAYVKRRAGLGGGPGVAVVASELDEVVRGAAPPPDLVLVLSRSGTTSELLRALDRLGGVAPTLAVLGDPDTPVAAAVDAVIALPFADERSVVQTRFATTALALLRASLGEDLEPVIAAAAAVLDGPAPEPRHDHVVFLGTDWTVGLAHEAALKCREAARMHTEAYPVGEYQHGPIAVAGPTTLVWSLGPLPDVLRANVLATGAEVREAGVDPMAELVAVHRLAVATAEARGIDPDTPVHLARSVILDAGASA